MTTVEPVSRNMIDQALRAAEYRFLTDQDGDFVVQFGSTNERPEMRVWIMIQGKEKDVLTLRTWNDKRFPKSHWSGCLVACNEWNRQRRIPKAVFDASDEEGQGAFSLEYDVPLSKGTFTDQIQDVIEFFIVGSGEFWRWGVKEKSFPL